MKSGQDVDPNAMAGPHLLTDLWRAFGFHGWLILAVTLGTVGCTYLALQFVNDEYVSVARLLVKLGRENVELPVTVEKGGLLSTGVRKEEINSEIQLIDSRPLVEATVDALGVAVFKLEPPPPVTTFQRIKAEVRAAVRVVREQVREWLIQLNLRKRLDDRENAVLLVQKALVVEREKDSDVITVSVRLPSDVLAMQVVDTLVGLYLNRRLDVRRDRGISDFFEEQLTTLRGDLVRLDASKLNLRDERRISAVNEERVLLLGRLQGLYAEIAADDRELRLLTPHRSASAALPGPAAVTADTALSSFPNLEQLRGKVTELRVRRTELLQKFTDNAEQVVRIDREVGQIEAALRQAFGSQRSERQATARSIEQRLQVLNAGELGLEVIERDRAVVNQNYQSYARRREEARISEALDLRRVSNIAVLAQADKPIEPASPRKLLFVGLAFPFGLLAGLALALFFEYTNQTIRDERDLSPAERRQFLGVLRSGKRAP